MAGASGLFELQNKMAAFKPLIVLYVVDMSSHFFASDT